MEKINVTSLVETKENVYFCLMLAFSIMLYLVLFVSIIGIFYVLSIALFLFIIQGLAIGGIQRNAVKISKDQLPDIYEKFQEYSSKLGLEKVPDIYLMQAGGLLNACATRFLFKDIVIIYSDILEMAYEQGENAVNFVIAHELAHVKRGHLSKMKYIACAQLIPFLGNAYSRACEHTCDRIASVLTNKLPIDGLLVLAAGKKLYNKINSAQFVSDAGTGFWCWCAEICSTHPSLATRVKRIANIQNAKCTDSTQQINALH